MRKLILIVFFFPLWGLGGYAQSGTVATDGVYVPRLTTAQRTAIITPTNGQMIYNTDDNCFNVYQKGAWQKLCGYDVTLLDTWTQKANVGGAGRYRATGFSIGSKGYIGTGDDGSLRNDFWEYDPTANTWTQKANFGGTPRSRAISFSIGSKGYIGTGNDGSLRNDFWEYDPTANTWTQKANFGGTARLGAVGFSIGNKGYIGTGNDGSVRNDFWEYDPTLNTWTLKANFGGTPRFGAVGFSIGSKGYIGTGTQVLLANDFWEYDPTLNTWTPKANFGGTVRIDAVGFSIGNKGYIGTGWDGSSRNDFWEYDPTVNTWSLKANFGNTVRYRSVGFSIGSKGYIGTGFDGGLRNDFWEYDPASPVNITQQGNVFNGANQLVQLDASGKINNEAFIAPTLLNGWVNYGTVDIPPNVYGEAGYYKDKENRVHLKGLIRSGTFAPGTVLFNLPVGYRPLEIKIYLAVNGSGFGVVNVFPNGDVRIMSGGNDYVSLDGITFRTEQ